MGMMFGIGVTVSAIQRGHKDGPLNHVFGGIAAASVLAMRGLLLLLLHITLHIRIYL